MVLLVKLKNNVFFDYLAELYKIDTFKEVKLNRNADKI